MPPRGFTAAAASLARGHARAPHGFCSSGALDNIAIIRTVCRSRRVHLVLSWLRTPVAVTADSISAWTLMCVCLHLKAVHGSLFRNTHYASIRTHIVNQIAFHGCVALSLTSSTVAVLASCTANGLQCVQCMWGRKTFQTGTSALGRQLLVLQNSAHKTATRCRQAISNVHLRIGQSSHQTAFGAIT